MFVSVTENASAVTDVLALLSDLGFDTGSGDGAHEVVIDKFDQWATPSTGSYYASTCIVCGMQLAA